MAQIRAVSPDSQPKYSATVLSSATEVAGLTELARRLTPLLETSREPAIFLSSLTRAWLPRVVVVRRGNAVVGIVCAKERRVAGFPTGIIYADGTFGNLAISHPDDEEDVLAVAIRKLFDSRFVHAIRLVIPDREVASGRIHRIISGMPRVEVYCCRADFHSSLTLPGDYEAFLQSLGYTTRRNFRYYRRRADLAGHLYSEALSPDELCRAVSHLRTRCSVPSTAAACERALHIVTAVEHRMCVGLRHRNGEWLSVAGGWYNGDRATMFFQLNNDQEFKRDSLSVVLRARLIETLIGKGVRELAFWAGTAAPLSRYVSQIPATGVYLDLPTPAWRLARSFVSTARAWLPGRLANDIDWIVPPMGQPALPPDDIVGGYTQAGVAIARRI